MECSICKNKYDIQDFNSLRIYNNDDNLIRKRDMCDNCINELSEKEKLEEFFDKFREKGYKLYKISRCPIFDDCEKINNLRIMCESKEAVDKSSSFDFHVNLPPSWCDPAEAGIITASIKLYDLFDNYDKNSTELSNNMLSYTRNMHHLTWVLLAFAVIGFILTFINAYIAYLQLIK
jgi:hypothetical protein